MDVTHLRDTGHGLSAGTDVQLLKNPLNMGADGAKTDLQGCGDFMVGPALQEQIEHLLLATGQTKGGGGGDAMAKGFNHPQGDLVTRRKLARGGFLDGRQQFMERRAFEEVAGSPGGERGENVIRIERIGVYKKVRARQTRFEPLETFKVMAAGETGLQENDIGLFGGQSGQRALGTLMNAGTANPAVAAHPGGKGPARGGIGIHDRHGQEFGRGDFGGREGAQAIHGAGGCNIMVIRSGQTVFAE